MGLAAEVVVPRFEEGVLVLMDQLFDATLHMGFIDPGGPIGQQLH